MGGLRSIGRSTRVAGRPGRPPVRMLICLVVGLLVGVACLGGPGGRQRTPRPTAVPTTTLRPGPPAAPTAGATPGQSAGQPNKWGLHLLLDDGVSQWPTAVWDEHLAYARRLVGRGGYVLELIRADDLDVPKWQGFLDLVARYELRPIIRLATWQDRQRGHWVAPRPDPDGSRYRQVAASWAAFFRALRFDGTLYAVVGNEPNRGDEWGGRPDAAQYARYLIDVSAALRAARPGLQVLNGGLDQYAPDTGDQAVNGFQAVDAGSYLEQMAAAEPTVWDALDLWAAHAYPLGPFAAPPSRRDYQVDDLLLGGPRTRVAPWPGLYNRGINSYRWELFKLQTLGLRRPLTVFVTETGWRHAESQGPSGDQQGAEIGSELAANYILRAFDGEPQTEPREYPWTPWSRDPEVGAAVIFALDGEPARWGHTNLLVLRPDGSVVGLRPQFAALLKP